MSDILTWRLQKATSFEELEEILSDFLADSCYVIDDPKDGSVLVETKKLVDHIGDLRIEIFPKEHAPPHFHISGNGVSVSFEIDSCKLLNGRVSEKDLRKIEYYHKRAKAKLVQFWNDTRPSDCPVGPIAI